MSTIVLYISGGSWIRCTPEEINPYARCFGDTELIPIRYDTIPQATMHKMVAEVAEAIQSARKKRGGKIIVCGRSAGGHLAALGSRICKPDGLILISAPLDLGKVPGCNIILPWRIMYNPIKHKLSIPTLLVHGTADSLVPIAAARSYAKASNCNYCEIEGATHDISIISAAEAQIQRFVSEVAKK